MSILSLNYMSFITLYLTIVYFIIREDRQLVLQHQDYAKSISQKINHTLYGKLRYGAGVLVLRNSDTIKLSGIAR